MGAKWGSNRPVAQGQALLHILPEALTGDKVCEHLNIARSNVSDGLKDLRRLGQVKSKRMLGDRRDHFTSTRGMLYLVTQMVENRLEGCSGRSGNR